MKNQIKAGDVVVLKAEYQDAGDADLTFRALENEDGGRVRIEAEAGLPINPQYVVTSSMIAEVKA